MAIIHFDKRMHLTEEQKEMASSALNNEIHEVMADLEILEDELEKTAMFGELNFKNVAIDHINQLFYDSEGNINEEVLQRVYKYYFSKEKEHQKKRRKNY